MQRGGKREGAGRKFGSTNKITQKEFSHFVSESDIEGVIKAGIEKAKSGDSRWGAFILERYFGKLTTSIDVQETKPLLVFDFPKRDSYLKET